MSNDWYRKNPERGRAVIAAYKKANPEKIKLLRKKWKESNPEKHAFFQARYKLNLDLTFEEYQALLERQKGLCAICKKPERAKRTTRLSIDHCHKTGRVRGLLCGNCNRALGIFGDDIKNLKSAIEYMKQSKETIEFLDKNLSI